MRRLRTSKKQRPEDEFVSTRPVGFTAGKNVRPKIYLATSLPTRSASSPLAADLASTALALAKLLSIAANLCASERTSSSDIGTVLLSFSSDVLITATLS